METNIANDSFKRSAEKRSEYLKNNALNNLRKTPYNPERKPLITITGNTEDELFSIDEHDSFEKGILDKKAHEQRRSSGEYEPNKITPDKPLVTKKFDDPFAPENFGK